MIKKLSIEGYRGFGEKQEIEFAIPNGKEGSGLTFLVGGNNCGKTSIIEALSAFNGKGSPTFSVGKRNPNSNERIEIIFTSEKDKEISISTIKEGGSETDKNGEVEDKIYSLQSRRFVDFEFIKGEATRDSYLDIHGGIKNRREPSINSFYIRLFEIIKKKQDFDHIVKKIVDKEIIWTIDQSDNGRYFVKFSNGNSDHNSEGIGDGIWSVFTIADALYDSKPRDIIAIDEPELSLHPSYQRRLMGVLMEYSKDRQIILSTHSPYFVCWEAITNGANLVRTVKDENFNIKVNHLGEDSRNKIKGCLKNYLNPHILGINANEAFFLDDNIILVEGQEDVIHYNRICEELGQNFNGQFFGWGAGGSGNIEAFLDMFNDLGYKKVVAILDGNEKEKQNNLKKKYTNYKIIAISTEDIRNKNIKAQNKIGFIDNHGRLKEEYKEEARNILIQANEYLSN